MVRVYPITPQSQFKNNSRATVPLSREVSAYNNKYFIVGRNYPGNVLTAVFLIRFFFPGSGSDFFKYVSWLASIYKNVGFASVCGP